jgi:hypothetical protein
MAMLGGGALLLLAACSPFGDCELDRIIVALPATVTLDHGVAAWDLSGSVTVGNLDRPTYDRLVGALIEGTRSLDGAVWTLDVGFGDEAGYLAVYWVGDPEEGQTVAVVGAFDGGGWGFLDEATQGPRVASRIGTVTASSASGTLTVLGTAPLRLSVDVTVADGSGVSYRFVGEMAFSRSVEPVSCD